ncbi:hypothetical protein V1477_018170 [Vespula maculifrons]|uniref:Uncharacterized protein n=1 Tax=Vespula maculifrons TaxID=7453 RepID=A0ABD2AYP3_VESMC
MNRLWQRDRTLILLRIRRYSDERKVTLCSRISCLSCKFCIYHRYTCIIIHKRIRVEVIKEYKATY